MPIVTSEEQLPLPIAATHLEKLSLPVIPIHQERLFAPYTKAPLPSDW